METKYKTAKGMKSAIGGLAVLAGIAGGLEIADRYTSSDIPVYTAAKRYIEEKAVGIYLRATNRSLDSRIFP